MLMTNQDMFLSFLLGVIFSVLLNKVIARRPSPVNYLSAPGDSSVSYLAPNLARFLITLKQAFRHEFPNLS